MRQRRRGGQPGGPTRLRLRLMLLQVCLCQLLCQAGLYPELITLHWLTIVLVVSCFVCDAWVTPSRT